MTDEPLDTHMEAHGGKPDAVAKALRMTAKAMDELPDDMQLSFELDVWEREQNDG